MKLRGVERGHCHARHRKVFLQMVLQIVKNNEGVKREQIKNIARNWKLLRAL